MSKVTDAETWFSSSYRRTRYNTSSIESDEDLISIVFLWLVTLPIVSVTSWVNVPQSIPKPSVLNLPMAILWIAGPGIAGGLRIAFMVHIETDVQKSIVKRKDYEEYAATFKIVPLTIPEHKDRQTWTTILNSPYQYKRWWHAGILIILGCLLLGVPKSPWLYWFCIYAGGNLTLETSLRVAWEAFDAVTITQQSMNLGGRS